MVNDYFTKLNIGLSPDNPIFSDYKNFPYEQVGNQLQNLEKETTFPQYSVPLDYFKNEKLFPLFSILNLKPKIFLVEKNYCYNWHRDAFRSLAFNLMLNEDDEYFVAFVKYISDNNQVESFRYKEFERLVYEKNKFYLLNNQVPHISINFGQEHRYILSIGNFMVKRRPGFAKGESFDRSSYYETIEILKQYNLV